jgi:hypothetical protein
MPMVKAKFTSDFQRTRPGRPGYVLFPTGMVGLYSVHHRRKRLAISDNNSCWQILQSLTSK